MNNSIKPHIRLNNRSNVTKEKISAQTSLRQESDRNKAKETWEGNEGEKS